MPIELNAKKATNKQPVDNGVSLRQAFSLAWEMGYTMAIPLVALALAGRLLDKYWNTSPLWLLIGIGVSIVLSSFLLAQKALKIIANLAQKEKPPKED